MTLDHHERSALEDLVEFPRTPWAFGKLSQVLVAKGWAERAKDADGKNWLMITEAGKRALEDDGID